MWHLLSTRCDTADYHQARLEAIVDVCRQWQRFSGSSAAGFTYWGQFIAHELGPRPPEVPSRTGSLDLDSIYGHLGTATPSGKLAVLSQDGRPFDLPRENKEALIPDPRNDENLIVAQFHLLMLRLHNAVATRLIIHERLTGESAFNVARQCLVAIFHHLTREQFLKVLLREKVYTFLFGPDDDTLFSGPFEPPANIQEQPAEVINGALRFGHSMIRNRYTLNVNKPKVTLATLFALTQRGGLQGQETLAPEFAIDWRSFFPFPEQTVQFTGARPIDPQITAEMMQVAGHNIVQNNLMRGIESKLPSGQEAVREILDQRPALEKLGLTENPVPAATIEHNTQLLKTAEIADRTPFWLFTLLDATRKGEGTDAAGATLGPFGSLFVGSAIKWAMENAPPALSIEDVARRIDHDISSVQDAVKFVETVEGENQ